MDPHKAIDYIIQNSVKYAQARANRLYLEEFRKSKKALLMKDALARGDKAIRQKREMEYGLRMAAKSLQKSLAIKGDDYE